MRPFSPQPRLLSVRVRVHVVDPSAYTPPYDHALCRALAAEGAEVELYTSRFAYGPVAPAEGYGRRETFYRAAARPSRGQAGGAHTGHAPLPARGARRGRGPLPVADRAAPGRSPAAARAPAGAERPRHPPARAAARAARGAAAAVRALRRGGGPLRARRPPPDGRAGGGSGARARDRPRRLRAPGRGRRRAGRRGAVSDGAPGGAVLRPDAPLQGDRPAAGRVGGDRGRGAVDHGHAPRRPPGTCARLR